MKQDKIINLTDSWQMIKLNEFRHRKVLSFFPFIVVNGFKSDFIWTGKWFKFIYIKEQKVKERFLHFDDGWTYQDYWSKWKELWMFIKIENPTLKK